MRAVEHITGPADRWDLLAWRYYGDPHAYEAIIRANPGVPISPILPSGLRLVIPLRPVDDTIRHGLPPWKR